MESYLDKDLEKDVDSYVDKDLENDVGSGQVNMWVLACGCWK